MKKLLIYLFVLISVGVSAQGPVTSVIPLTRGGSITIPYNGIYDVSTLYRCTTDSTENHTDTLATDLSFIYSGRAAQIGTTFTLWFNNTHIITGSHKIFILSNDFTNLLSNQVNLELLCQYNGHAWTVFSVDSTISLRLTNYVTLTQLNDTLTNYVQQEQITNTVDTLAGINSGNFNRILVPLTSTSDSSLNAWNSAEGKRVLQSYAKLASPVFTGAPLSTTPATNDNSTKIATTNFVDNYVASYEPPYFLCGGTISSTVALSTGAGTGATATVTGNAADFQVNLTTGSAPATSATICTVSFTNAYPNTPLAYIQPRNSIAAASAAFQLVIPSESTSGISFVSGGTGLAATTQYIFNVHVGAQ